MVTGLVIWSLGPKFGLNFHIRSYVMCAKSKSNFLHVLLILLDLISRGAFFITNILWIENSVDPGLNLH